MIRLAVFDWNGTLLADFKAVVEGLNKELEVVNRPPVSAKDYREHYEVPTVQFFSNLGIGRKEFKAKRMEMARAFHAYYEPRVAKVRSGARQTLQSLKKRGVICVILSNHTMEGIYLQLERLKLSPYFSAVLANDGIGLNHYEGKEARLRQYLTANNFLPSQTIIIGDTVEEVRIGRNLGLKTACLSGGYHSVTRLKQTKPDILVSKLPDMLERLKEL